MSISIKIKAYSGKNSSNFQRHFKAVKFCIENNLSFPKETSEFFKGKLGGDDLEDIRHDSILSYIENGVEVPLHMSSDEFGRETRIKVCDIPDDADEIVVTLV